MFASVFALVFAGLAAAGTIPGCSREYTVQDGDYCDLISAAHNSSTYQLAVSNYKTINDGCTNLEVNQVICLATDAATDCATTYVVKEGDYCNLIAGNHGINSTLLMTNNPQIDDNCSNLYVGEALCVANRVLVTPPPAGWTLPGSHFDDADFASSADEVVHDTPTHKSTTKTTTSAPAATTTKAPSSGTKSTKTSDKSDDSKTSGDSKTSDDDKKDTEEEDDDDCSDY